MTGGKKNVAIAKKKKKIATGAHKSRPLVDDDENGRKLIRVQPRGSGETRVRAR